MSRRSQCVVTLVFRRRREEGDDALCRACRLVTVRPNFGVRVVSGEEDDSSARDEDPSVIVWSWKVLIVPGGKGSMCCYNCCCCTNRL